jgi:Ca2+-binding EF-hand superfamily protein
MLELRKGFLALNIDIGYVLKLLKLFDKDQKGAIDIREFYDAFGPEYKDETDNIILKKAG